MYEKVHEVPHHFLPCLSFARYVVQDFFVVNWDGLVSSTLATRPI